MRKTIMAAMVILAVAFLLTACTSRSPEETAKRYFNALVAGDVKTLESCKLPLSQSISSVSKEVSRELTNSMFGMDLSDAGMNSSAGLILAYTFGGYDFKIKDAEISSNKAIVYFDIYIDGSLYSSQEYLPLTKYNGDWYVDYTGYYS